MTLKTFASGETYCRYEDSIRGADIFIVQTASVPVDQHLMELLIMINAAKLASAKRITAVIPWYFYVRQDKKSRPREPITAKLVADLLQTAGADRVLTMDLHAGQVQGFFEIPVDHMTAVPMFAQYVRDLNLGESPAVVSPDTGHAKIAGKFAEMVGGDLVILNKVRPAHNEAKVTTVIGDVEGKVAVIIDDVIDTAGTLVAGAKALKDAGATKVYACATHGLFNGAGPRADRRERDPQARRHRHRAARPARASPTTSRCCRSRASWPRRSRTCSPTTPCRRSSPGRTSCSRTAVRSPARGTLLRPAPEAPVSRDVGACIAPCG